MMKTKITTVAIIAALYGSASATVTIDWVMVNDAGNAADPATGSLYGAVAYDYQIAKNETTISQYADFLNAVAKTDSYGLYHASITGISRSGTSGNYTYTTSGSSNRPVNYVSWFDAARFANWIHNGQQTGIGAALTAENGAYTLNGSTSGIITKNVGATVWIPSEDEWYKAAYYDPTKNSGVGGYWLHANQSDSMTSNTIGVSGAANYFDGDYALDQNGLTSLLTDVGAYGMDSQSYYGTNDQTGNLREWNDLVFGSARGLRGGNYNDPAPNLTVQMRSLGGPEQQFSTVGFRLASVPEPSSIILSLLASGALLTRRSRRG